MTAENARSHIGQFAHHRLFNHRLVVADADPDLLLAEA